MQVVRNIVVKYQNRNFPMIPQKPIRHKLYLLPTRPAVLLVESSTPAESREPAAAANTPSSLLRCDQATMAAAITITNAPTNTIVAVPEEVFKPVDERSPHALDVGVKGLVIAPVNFFNPLLFTKDTDNFVESTSA